MHKLVLVRHGQSTWNLENRFTGMTDVDLTDHGTAEAVEAGKLLKDAGFDFDIAYTSVLKRAIKTLGIIQDVMNLDWLPVVRAWQLNERHYGALQGLNKAETAKQYGEDQVKVWRRSYDIPPPALELTDERHPRFDRRYAGLAPEVLPATESLKITLDRVLPYWNSTLAPEIKSGKRLIVVAHGNSIRALVKYLDNVSEAEITELNIPTGLPLVYELDDDLKPIKNYYLGDPLLFQNWAEYKRVEDASVSLVQGFWISTCTSCTNRANRAVNFPRFNLLVVCLAGWMTQQQNRVIEFLMEENRTLRELVGRKRRRLNDRQRRRLAIKAQPISRKVLQEICSLVTPDTLRRWHKSMVARKYDGSQNRQLGRPPVMSTIKDLIVRMARENSGWGYTRIKGALDNLGHEIGRSTILRTLRENGLDPAPERSRSTSWKEFLKAHWDGLAATDLFTVEVWTLRGLIRFHVLFMIEVATRRVHIAGMSGHPHGAWMEQLARNLTDPVDGFLRHCKTLVHDRDSLFTAGFDSILSSTGIKPIKLPVRSPNLNAYAERFVKSVRTEVLDKMIFLGEEHLRRTLSSYLAYYHHERNHQGLENKLIEPDNLPTDGHIRRRQRLGAMLNYYYREAA